jgi:hypothetical protein
MSSVIAIIARVEEVIISGKLPKRAWGRHAEALSVLRAARHHI